MPYSGVTTAKEAADTLVLRLDAFYDVRNNIIHSLNSNTGLGVEVIFGYLELFEATAESIKNILAAELSAW
jgi:hypothetical protein